jgi:hypothetical protein
MGHRIFNGWLGTILGAGMTAAGFLPSVIIVRRPRPQWRGAFSCARPVASRLVVSLLQPARCCSLFPCLTPRTDPAQQNPVCGLCLRGGILPKPGVHNIDGAPCQSERDGVRALRMQTAHEPRLPI